MFCVIFYGINFVLLFVTVVLCYIYSVYLFVLNLSMFV